MTIVRTRLSPEASRAAALAAARTLLLDGGLEAVTLKAIAAMIGKTHVNLLHHFGSAERLQSELAARVVEDAVQVISAGARHVEAEGQGADLVDRVFEAFDRHGIGALLRGTSSRYDGSTLRPIVAAIRTQIHSASGAGSAADTGERKALQLMLIAIGDAVFGEQLATMLELDRNDTRIMAVELLAGRR